MGSLWADLELLNELDFPDWEDDGVEPSQAELLDEEEENSDGWNIVRCDKCGKDYDLLNQNTRTEDGMIICPHCKTEQ